MSARDRLLEKLKNEGRPPEIQAPSATVEVKNNGSPNGSAKTTSYDRRRKAQMDLTYCEFNFTTMADSKAGFIAEDQGGDDQDTAKRRKTEHAKEPPMPVIDGAECMVCRSIDVDTGYQRHYGVNVCRDCKEKDVSRFGLLTKTECKEDYLLTDSELKDHTKMPTWERPNPHKATYANMLLYLRMQVEAFAIEKWGSLEALDAEFERRKVEKNQKADQKMQKKIKDLRKKTRTSIWKSIEPDHRHDLGEKLFDAATGMTTQKCKTCEYSITFEEL